MACRFKAAKPDKDAALKVSVDHFGEPSTYPERLVIQPREVELNIPDGVMLEDPLLLFYLFFRKEDLDLIAYNINQYATSEITAKSEHSQYERHWEDVIGDDIGGYLGALLLIGVHPTAGSIKTSRKILKIYQSILYQKKFRGIDLSKFLAT
jgi:hypothetical protein